MNFTPFGSRANGTARENSDWDVLFFPEQPVHPGGRYWGDVSRSILDVLMPIHAIEALAREELDIPDGDDVDLFVKIEYPQHYAARLLWDDHHECLDGWLTTSPFTE